METTITRETVGIFIATSELKQYLGLNTDFKDDELASAIATATTEVEDRYNVALRPMTIQLVGDSDDCRVKLYYPRVNSVVSVMDLSGNRVRHDYIAPLSTVRLDRDNTVIVDYNVEPHSNTIAYKSKVMARAALIYNGEV